MNLCRFFGALFVVLLAAQAAAAQELEPQALDRPLRLFLDCQADCDFEFFRTEAPFVDFVRDRVDADFHVMVFREGTGGGGSEYEIRFIGSGAFGGLEESYSFVTDRNATFDERRTEMLRVFQMGVLPYVARTPAASSVRITSTQSAYDADDQPVADPWNLWVFRVGTSAEYDEEEQLKEYSVNGSFSANRTTADWKFNFDFDGRLRNRNFTLSDGRTVISETSNWDGEALLVRSMNGHWSLGTFAQIGASSENNQDLRSRLATASEYNFYRYEDSTERQFTVLYSVGVTGFDYVEETIFRQTAETLLDHALNVAYELREPWGFVNASAEASTYLHDFSKNRLNLDGRLNFRVFRGLSVNLNATAERIRDQLYLPRGDATDEEILTEQRQLATGYRYRARLGFNYNFGSIFNTVVNPRFTGSSRRF